MVDGGRVREGLLQGLDSRAVGLQLELLEAALLKQHAGPHPEFGAESLRGAWKRAFQRVPGHADAAGPSTTLPRNL